MTSVVAVSCLFFLVGAPPGSAAPADFDGDGVPDLEDDCPTDPGSPANRGCPERPSSRAGAARPREEAKPTLEVPAPRVKLAPGRLELSETIAFESGRATLTRESQPLLLEVARVLRGLPAGRRVMVDGHTDDRGSRAHNIRLSIARAQAVVDALAQAGVPREHLKARGFGPDQPLAPNASDAGRMKNRRVEFLLVDD